MATIAKSDVPEERQWAWDIRDEEDFKREFMTRFPACDVIPKRDKYIFYKLKEHRGINSFNEEMLEIEDFGKKEEEKEVDFSCPGCGKHFDAKHIGRRNHLKTCKELLNKRM